MADGAHPLARRVAELLLGASGLIPTATRQFCPRRHPDAVYGVTNAEGYRRCRKCLSENQKRHHARKTKQQREASKKRRAARVRRATPATASSTPTEAVAPLPPAEEPAPTPCGRGVCSGCDDVKPLFRFPEGIGCRECHQEAAGG